MQCVTQCASPIVTWNCHLFCFSVFISIAGAHAHSFEYSNYFPVKNVFSLVLVLYDFFGYSSLVKFYFSFKIMFFFLHLFFFCIYCKATRSHLNSNISVIKISCTSLNVRSNYIYIYICILFPSGVTGNNCLHGSKSSKFTSHIPHATSINLMNEKVNVQSIQISNSKKGGKFEIQT